MNVPISRGAIERRGGRSEYLDTQAGTYPDITALFFLQAHSLRAQTSHFHQLTLYLIISYLSLAYV